MSGEAVLVPVIPVAAVMVAAPLVLFGVGAAGATVVVARGVQRLIDQRVETARRQAELEKRQRAERWAACLSVHQAGTVLARDQAAGRTAERELARRGLREVAARQVETPAATGYSAPASATTPAIAPAIAAKLADLADLFETLPTGLRDSSVGRRLERQARRWLEPAHATGPALVTLAEIEALRDTVQRTLAHHRECLARAETLLEAALFLLHLGGEQPELATLIQRLDAALARGEIAPTSLALLEQRLDALQQDIARTVALDSLRPALQEAALRHLRALGYTVLADFTTVTDSASARALLRVPGGEQLEMAVHTDGRLAFRVRHERAEPSSAPLSRAEKALLRQQEARWCGDVRQLLRELAAEGFALNLSFERKIPDPAIQIAVLETPAEWETRETAERREQERFTQPTVRSRPQ
ncbi:MAG: hypothetical protein P9E67_09920 [Candidatus Competibacter sp.]|nr:hypothetical protein [Candidatus Competibacter sp.]